MAHPGKVIVAMRAVAAPVILALSLLAPLLLAPLTDAKPNFSKPRSLERDGVGVGHETAVAMPGGRSAVSWQGLMNEGPDQVRLSVVDRRGRPATPLTLDGGYPFASQGPASASIGAGGVGVLWLSFDAGVRGTSSASAIDLARIDRNGDLAGQVRLDEEAAGTDARLDSPKLATGPTGTGVAMWGRIEDPVAPDRGPDELRWVRLGGDGEPVGAVQATEISYSIPNFVPTGQQLQVVVDERGRITVLIEGRSQIRLLQIDPDDDPGPGVVLAGPSPEIGSAELAIDADGRVTVAWRAKGTPGEARDRIVVRRVDSDGVLGPPLEVASSKRRLGKISMAHDSRGRTLLAWARSKRPRAAADRGAAVGRIVLARLRRDGGVAYAQPITPKRLKSTFPDLGVDGRDRLYATFQRKGPVRDRCGSVIAPWRVAALRLHTRTGKVRWRRHLGRGAFATVGGGGRVMFVWDRPGGGCRQTVVSRPLG